MPNLEVDWAARLNRFGRLKSVDRVIEKSLQRTREEFEQRYCHSAGVFAQDPVGN